MKEKILALLTAKFTGMRKDGLTALARSLALQCTTEEEAQSLIEKVTDAQVTEYIKEYRADIDKEMSESNKTFESNLRKKFDFVEKVDTVPGGDDPKPQDANDIQKMIQQAVATAMKPLQDELSVYKQGDIAKSRLDLLNGKLAECKDETFKAQTLKDFARMQFETDEDFNQYLTDKATDIANANQHLADSMLGASGSPLFAQKDNNGISKGVAEFLKDQKPENELSGKEL